MIQVPPRSLPPDLQGMLDELQATLDARSTYAERVQEAAQAWERKPRERFSRIKSELIAMCTGEDRCMYCEDSAGDEIEHLRPKSLYPEHTFAWSNYLLACGPCNGPKNNRFSVLSRGRRQLVDVARPRGAPVVPPERGRTMLLDPRREDPVRFLSLDLAGSFHLQPLHGRSCLARARAEYTIAILRLNRDPLPRRRAVAHGNYLARLKEYVKEQDPAARDRLRRALMGLDHPTVWREMKRQHAQIPELRALFAEAHEALAW